MVDRKAATYVRRAADALMTPGLSRSVMAWTADGGLRVIDWDPAAVPRHTVALALLKPAPGGGGRAYVLVASHIARTLVVDVAADGAAQVRIRPAPRAAATRQRARRGAP